MEPTKKITIVLDRDRMVGFLFRPGGSGGQFLVAALEQVGLPGHRAWVTTGWGPSPSPFGGVQLVMGVPHSMEGVPHLK